MYEPIEDLSLSESLPLLLGQLYFFAHVPVLAVHHDDVEVALWVHEIVLVGNDVCVPETLEEVELVLNALTNLAGAVIVEEPELLHHVELVLMFVFAEEHLP